MPTKLAAQTLRILLDLIYHEKVSAPIETVFDVLLAADKYKEYLYTYVHVHVRHLNI